MKKQLKNEKKINLPAGARDLSRDPVRCQSGHHNDMALVEGHIEAQTAVRIAVWAFFYAGGAVLRR